VLKAVQIGKNKSKVAACMGFESVTGRRARPDKLSVFDRASVKDIFERHDIKPIWLRALYTEICFRGLCDLSKLIEIPPPRRFPRRAFELLTDHFVLNTSSVKMHDGCKVSRHTLVTEKSSETA
jgi:hypothetical protein